MNGRSVAFAILLSAGAVAGVLYLLGAQFADGGTYPEYSSLRSDPAGTKLLFDTLARIPGTGVTRNYLPLEYLNGSGATVLLLNLNLAALAAEDLAGIDGLAARGNRVVASASEVFVTPPNSGPLAKTWKVQFGFDIHAPRDERLFFSESPGWKTISQDGSKALAIERATGKGSVVLFADSSTFANANVADTSSADFPLLSTAIGPYSRVVFDEQHLGIAQTGSVVGLVRRFRLTGMALGFAICAALLIWRNVTAFPPPAIENGADREIASVSARTSRSGLLTLVRRHVPPSELAAVCWNEWLAANRRAVTPEGISRAQEAIRQSATEPVRALREIQSMLHSKGTL